MGKYLFPNAPDKIINLLAYGAREVLVVPAWADIPEQQALVCVGDMGGFSYAAYIYDENEYHEFTRPEHVEPQRWFLVDRKFAENATTRPTGQIL